MKKALFTLGLAVFGLVWNVAAEEVAEAKKEIKVYTDFAKASEDSKKGEKVILLDFTGSDWCGWCVKFQKEVLVQEEFIKYAEDKLIFVEVDFPARKKLSDEQKKANNELKEKYSVRGFPTYILVDSEGKELGKQVGYKPGGAKAFIASIEEWKTK
jgi:protein disulfide-isomerase